MGIDTKIIVTVIFVLLVGIATGLVSRKSTEEKTNDSFIAFAPVLTADASSKCEEAINKHVKFPPGKHLGHAANSATDSSGTGSATLTWRANRDLPYKDIVCTFAAGTGLTGLTIDGKSVIGSAAEEAPAAAPTEGAPKEPKEEGKDKGKGKGKGKS
jgi:hypothetical protein